MREPKPAPTPMTPRLELDRVWRRGPFQRQSRDEKIQVTTTCSGWARERATRMVHQQLGAALSRPTLLLETVLSTQAMRPAADVFKQSSSTLALGSNIW
jgi:hypothetical protein